MTELDAIRLYARMINTLDASVIEPHLAPDVRYTSMWVFSDLIGKEAVLNYFQGKITTWRQTLNNKPRMEIGETCEWADSSPGRPCAVAYQSDSDTPDAMLMVTTENGLIQSMDLCIIFEPGGLRRTGEFPE